MAYLLEEVGKAVDKFNKEPATNVEDWLTMLVNA